MYREKQDYAGDLGIADSVGRLSRAQKIGIGCLGLIVVWIGAGVMLGASGDGSTATAGMNCRTSADGMESCSKDLPFADCLGVIQQQADELGVAPINIVETTSRRMVRFPASDGSVLVTCDGGEINITLSPHSGF